ncbi:SMP-30/gluconolactonase/LRE family protein [Bradyrhizobium centrolobii]|uniref:SMP-30/gluconolactonase/LRE family protein n=1 Tax=Bradyrhizobium centrolobii TaxID=1505087 RepID=UPI00191BBB29|nr:SMP-30/gluconolactonase/LRE family protein [Bradyrhizobium centrolobii]
MFGQALACAVLHGVAGKCFSSEAFAEEAAGQPGLNFYPSPQLIKAEIYTEMPGKFRRTGVKSEWSTVNKVGQPPVDSFIEGLTLDHQGNLYVVDVPFGRLFRISADREWTQLAEWDGEPGGMALHPNGKFFITDYKQGLLTFDPATSKIEPFLGRRDSERFKGLNDLTFALNGDIYFTDQGQTGLQDPTGRVYRLRTNGQLDLLLSTGIRPNGLVLHPNETVLFVAMTRDNSVWRVPLFPDGTTGKVGRFASFYGVSGPDSIFIDEQANLFVPHASLGSVFVINPDGEPIARIVSPKGKTTTNAKFGSPDRKTVYITQSDTGAILKASWHVPGRRVYADAERK